ncbi:MAG: DNA-binding protein [Actinomycetota bacterium]|nr:DNA-binding protein [Actinomycetota bacterium]
MNEYEFTLRFDVSRVRLDPVHHVEELASNGCDDATIGTGILGRVALLFFREAVSAEDAVMSALHDVIRALPNAKLIEAVPDLVGITEIAETVGKTRQNIRKLLVSCGADAPLPVHEGSSSIWHLAHVLTWLRDAKQYQIDDELVDLANTNMQLNSACARISVAPRIERGVEELQVEA